jgi:hypothetical protein
VPRAAPIVNAMLRRTQAGDTYPIVVAIETNRGRGETRAIGPTRVTFATSAPFEIGDAIRFAIAMPGDAGEMLDIFCAGSVCAVSVDGELFVVDASIEESQISIAKKEEDR